MTPPGTPGSEPVAHPRREFYLPPLSSPGVGPPQKHPEARLEPDADACDI